VYSDEKNIMQWELYKAEDKAMWLGFTDDSILPVTWYRDGPFMVHLMIFEWGTSRK